MPLQLREPDRTTIVDNNGLGVYAYEFGPADADTTVVFVHGFTLAAKSFKFQVEYLDDAWPTIRSLAMDLRGHGRTGEVPASACTVDLAATDVLANLTELAPHGQLILVGHSLGAPVVLSALRQMDPQTHQRVAGLIIVSGAVDKFADQGLAQVLSTGAAKAVYDEIEENPREMEKVRRAITKRLSPVLKGGFFFRAVPDEVVEFHAEMIQATPLATLVGFADDLMYHEEYQAAPALEGIPGYVIVGEKDIVAPRTQSKKLADIWPGSYRQVAHIAGHMVILEAPHTVNTALERLLRVANPAKAEPGTH